jgi:hypothetical protein
MLTITHILVVLAIAIDIADEIYWRTRKLSEDELYAEIDPVAEAAAGDAMLRGYYIRIVLLLAIFAVYAVIYFAAR